MSNCLSEGVLRAYFDRELPSEEMASCALHLAACADCHADYNEIAARSTRVSAWMTALDAPALRPPAAASWAGRWNRALPAAALALAAMLAYAFVVAPKRVPSKPVMVPVARPVQPGNPVRVAKTQPAQPLVETSTQVSAADVSVSAPVRLRPRAHHQIQLAAAKAKVDYYLAFDDQPIETGYIVRVDVGDRQADVIFDGEGRARAIRPVTTQSLATKPLATK